jgi:energy-coupling factor transporter transmembrane protein EcfT
MGLIDNLKIKILGIVTFCVIVLSIIEAYVSSSYALGFASTGVLGLFILLQIGLIIGLLVVGRKKKERICLLFSGVLLVVFLLGQHFGGNHKGSLHKVSEIKGNEIVIAVTKFQKERGQLPFSINELVPTYMVSIPTPDFKNSEYFYNTNKDRTNFWVGYRASTWLLCQKSIDSEWHCSD